MSFVKLTFLPLNSFQKASSSGGSPIKESEVALRPTTKILQGDWVWHSNRTTTDQQNLWHNFKGKRVEVMLFGDGHVANSKFPAATVATDPNFWANPPDMNFTWW